METLGVDRVEATGEGEVSVFMRPQEFHYNPIGSVHGGVISMLLDTAAACAVHTTLPAGMAYTSLDLNVRFLRPVTVGVRHAALRRSGAFPGAARRRSARRISTTPPASLSRTRRRPA